MITSVYDYNVFINCPFDKQYKPILHSIVFAIYDCGFIARSSLEITDSGHNRIDKIFRIIKDCRCGIHDISKTELDTDGGCEDYKSGII